MRPERLTLVGFSAFGTEQVIDFTGTDLFALAGPTGAGKSSIIDAIGFALYGTIPRLANQTLVGPAITAGQVEAWVSLEFSIGGVAHTATRVVRKDKHGKASTKEARLERGEDLLAEDPDGMSAAVRALLGLSFTEFCRCVVLPQGAFAVFLHDKSSARQDLLVGLLGAHLYGDIRERAVATQREAEAAALATEKRIAGALAEATPEAVAAAAARIVVARDLVDATAAAVPALAAIDERRRAAADTAAREREWATRVGAIRLPDGVEALATTITSLRASVDATEAAEKAASAAAAAAQTARDGLGDRRAVEAGLAAHAHVTTAEAELGRRRTAAATARTTARAATEAAAVHAAEVAHLRDVEEQLRHARAAQSLVPAIAVGAPCPVCRQTVHELPSLDEADDWRPAKQAADEAEAAQREAATAAARLDGAAGAAEEQVARAERDLAAAATAAEAAGPISALDAALLAIDAADAALAEARSADATARTSAASARKRLVDASAAEGRARADLDRARDPVVELHPPTPQRLDLAADWSALVQWAAAEAPRREAAAGAASEAATAAAAEAEAILATLRARLADADVAVRAAQSPSEAAAAELAEATTRHETLERLVAQADELRAELAVAQEAGEVARSLALQLNANRFEKWLLDEAFGELLEGATGMLRDLSNGAYSLELDAKREFSVVDHRNADERRSVRTLSGGETFLASLALALSLADKVVALAPGQVRLESLFLDEGFGTLDPATLDTVAGAIEHLGAGGRMIGIVTHVRELAERLPVRFDVRRGAKGSTVERVQQ